MNKILIGYFSGNSTFTSGDDKYTLTSISRNSDKEPKDNPFQPAWEREGLFAIIGGFVNEKTILETYIIELLPSWSSDILDSLIKSKTLTWKKLSEQLLKSQKSIVGDTKPKDPTIIITPVSDTDSSTKPLCALVVGHRKSSKGASSKKFNINEFDFNSEIAAAVKAKIKNARVEIVFRTNTKNGYSTLPGKINRLKPNFIVSLHCNAASPAARGTEMLYWHSSKTSKKLARIMQDTVLAEYGFRDRGLKARNRGDRGATLLANTKAPCIITEPFFLSNDAETETVINAKTKMIKAYANGIDKMAKDLF